MNYYVYMLVNPATNLPFYVGMGQNDRAWTHLQKWDHNNRHKSSTIAKIRDLGLEPVVNLVKEGMSKLEAGVLETNLITLYKKKMDGGILTNIADGGIGGDNSKFFTETSRGKISNRHSGEGNPNCKLTADNVIAIYKSPELISVLARKFNIGPAEIRKIKHKKSWHSVLRHVTSQPGFHYKNRFEFFTTDELIQEVTDIYLDDRSDSAIACDYNLGVDTVRRIKSGKIYQEFTSNLVLPETTKYSLTVSERNEIKNSTIHFSALAKKFGVHVETIRNIKKR